MKMMIIFSGKVVQSVKEKKYIYIRNACEFLVYVLLNVIIYDDANEEFSLMNANKRKTTKMSTV